MSHPTNFDPSTAVAVIGLEGRFPGAADIDQFWRLLCEGREGLERLSDQELLDAGVDPAVLEGPRFVNVGARLGRLAQVDAELFGYTPREAEVINPQQRVFLECSYRALENSGYDPSTYGGLIGVYGAVAQSSYVFNMVSRPDKMAAIDQLSIRIGNENDYVANRVGFKLDLRGPCVNVQSACSSGLVAVHVAANALLNGETDIALAGAVCGTEIRGYTYREGAVHSSDGHCRTFDADANGTVFTPGAGIVVLKRYEDALEDGDHIRAVILGSAINNDGEQKVGYTAPGVEGQRRVILEALEVADVDPATISYVEAHGTATSLGDPIEISALSQAWREHTDKVGFCSIGSVKSNVGHADAAAGIVGFIKTVLVLENRQLPASLNFSQPNSQIDFANSPFVVQTELADWQPAANGVRRAAVSSFGMGGTNAHMILEEAPVVEASASTGRPHQLLALSARTESALAAACESLADHLETHPETELADVAWTLQVGRKAHQVRRTLVVGERAEAAAALRSGDAKKLPTALTEAPRPVVFMFPGQGAQHVGMAAELYRQEPTFRAELERCARGLEPHLGVDLISLLYPADDQREAATERLTETAVTQPALFAVEYALAQLWLEWGVRPQAMIGHSIGEYVAACLAGVFQLDDALALVAARGRLMQELPPGEMLAVALPAADLEPLLDGQLALAAANSSRRSVVSGPADELAAFTQRLKEQHGVEGRPLHTSHAFHSPMMEPVLAPFEAKLSELQLRAPETPFVSNLSGRWITDEEATDPSYWARHLRHAVRFAEGLETLFEEPNRVLLEVGPGRTLATLARQHQAKPAELVAITSLPHPRDEGTDQVHAVTALAELWRTGVGVSWRGFQQHESRRRVQLPGYHLEGQRYWIEPGASGTVTLSHLDRQPLADWFHAPSWRPSAAPLSGDLSGTGPWLLLGDRDPLSEALSDQLTAAGCAVFSVHAAAAGEGFDKIGERSYRVRPGERQDFGHALAAIVTAAGQPPSRILHLWGLAGERAEHEARGFWSLLFLAQEMGGQAPDGGLKMQVLTRGLTAVRPDDPVEPLRATVLGPCRVLPREIAGLEVGVLDLDAATGSPAELADLVLAEALAPAADSVVAYRDGLRFVEQLESLPLDAVDERRLPLREQGVYLITGGLGGLGLTFAADLAKRCQARLALVSRTELPPREEWSRLAQAKGGDGLGQRLAALLALEEAGGEVATWAADVTDATQMSAVLQQAEEKFGGLHGVIHAAGSAGGGLAQLKTPEAARQVLAPKVNGTLVLEEVLGDRHLDFMVLTSSTLGRLGPLGQIDYCAANCFLDAFAQDYSRRQQGRVVSIAWDAWAEVGMAVSSGLVGSSQPKAPVEDTAGLASQAGAETPATDTAASAIAPASPVSLASSELVLQRLTADGTRSTYAIELDAASQWLMAEHLVAGRSTLPGTAYLELARQVYREHVGEGALEVRELYFLAPLMLMDGETRQVELTVEEQPSGGWALMVASAQPPMSGGPATRVEHARAQLEPLTVAAPPIQPPASLGAPLPRQIELGDGLNTSSSFVSWGPRWQSLQEMKTGAEEALAHLRLADDFTADLEHWRLHPALLDVATGIGGGLLAQDMYLPLSYHRVKIWQDLPAEIFSHLRWQGEFGGEVRETLSFDVSLLGSSGERLVEIEGFTLKRVRQATSRAVADSETPAGAEAGREVSTQAATGLAIRPGEGVEALYRVLSRCKMPQVMVSVRDPKVLLAHLAAKAQESQRPSGGGHARPDLETGFVAPRTETERQVAEVWQEQLGLAEVGVDDNFFDLGGDSVVGLQLVARLAEIGFQVAAEHLFEHQTVAELAAHIEGGGETEAADPSLGSEAEDDYSEDGGLGDEDLAKVLARLEGLT